MFVAEQFERYIAKFEDFVKRAEDQAREAERMEHKEGVKKKEMDLEF